MLKSNRFAVLVPLLGTSILRGSAVVVSEEEWEALNDGITPVAVAFYEGDVDGRFGHSFADKLLHAAGRCRENYPTIAKMAITAPADWVDVGRYDMQLRLMHITDSERLTAWAPDAQRLISGDGLAADRYVVADRGALDARHPLVRRAFWSERAGWVRITQATTFSAGEVLSFALPVGRDVGWVALTEVHRLRAA